MSSASRALDAEIRQRRAPAARAPRTVAEALDAADGKMDGKFYGSRIVEAPPTRKVGGVTTSGLATSGVTTSSGYTAQRVAEALDAADGQMDGRFFGSRIVTGSSSPTRRVVGGSTIQGGTTFAGGNYVGGNTTFAGGNYVGGTTLSGGRSYVSGTTSYSGAGNAQRVAEALDAADGRMDGRFFGRRIVTSSGAPATSGYVRHSAAQALDMADGVADGRFYGTPIVDSGLRYGYAEANVGPVIDRGTRVTESVGAPRLVHVHGGVRNRSKVVEVPVVHHETRVPVEIEVPVEIPVEVRVPVEVPYPVERLVEVPYDVVREVEVTVDVPVEVRVPYPVEKIVEKVVEQVVHVPGPTRVVEKVVEVEKIVEVEVEVEQVREVEVPYPVEKIVERVVQQPVPVEHIREVPEEHIVEKVISVDVQRIVEKTVQVPYPVERLVEKVVHVPETYIVEKVVQVPVEKIVERVVKVPVETIVHVPEERIVRKVVEVEVPYENIVEKVVTYPVEKIVEVAVDVPIEKIVERVIKVPVEVPVERVVTVPVERVVQVPVENIVEKIVQVPVERIVERVVRVPVEVPGPARENIIYQDREVPTVRVQEVPPPLPRPPMAVRWIAVPVVYPHENFEWGNWSEWWKTQPQMQGALGAGVGVQQYHGASVAHAAPYMTTGMYGSSAASALDAADGVMDGRYFGARIMQGGPTMMSRYPTGVTGGTSLVPTGLYGSSAANALDAADGVMDGRYFGARIVQGGPNTATSYGATLPSYALTSPARNYSTSSGARALDACDGVMDGRYFGAPIIG